MTKRTIVITYDTDTVGLDDGDTDLFSYLVNELNNRKLQAYVTDHGEYAEAGKNYGGLHLLVSTVEAAGGLIKPAEGALFPKGDPDWLDLADAYLAACEDLGIEPKIMKEEA